MLLTLTLMLECRYRHSESQHIGGSLRGAPLFSVERLAEIFSIRSTWRQCHWLHIPQLPHNSTHIHLDCGLWISNACELNTFPWMFRWWNGWCKDPQMFGLLELIMTQRCVQHLDVKPGELEKQETRPVTTYDFRKRNVVECLEYKRCLAMI